MRDVEGSHFVREVPHSHPQHVVIAKGCYVDAHRTCRLTSTIYRHTRIAPDICKFLTTLVMEQLIFHRIVGDQQVHPAVLVQIGSHHSERLCQRNSLVRVHGVNTHLLRNVAELAPAIIAVQERKSTPERLRLPVRPPVRACQFEVLCQINFTRPQEVVANEKVQQTIVVVIKKRTAGTPFFFIASHACLCSHLSKFPSIIAIQMIGAHCGQKEVLVTVVIVVTDRGSHPVKRVPQTYFHSDIDECSCAIIAVKVHCRRRLLGILVPRPALRINQQQVLISIAIVINECASSPHRFRQ